MCSPETPKSTITAISFLKDITPLVTSESKFLRYGLRRTDDLWSLNGWHGLIVADGHHSYGYHANEWHANDGWFRNGIKSYHYADADVVVDAATDDVPATADDDDAEYAKHEQHGHAATEAHVSARF